MQFRDLKEQYKVLKVEIDAGIQEVIDSCGFILGKKVVELEEKLAAYVGRKYCVCVGNGTDALQLSLMAYDIGQGDAVFTSDFTYFASAGCASIIGATPVLVDIKLDTFNIDPEAFEEAVKRTISEGRLTPKAVIPVDLFGQPAEMDRIIAIAKKYNMIVLEDAAQGFGGNINGKRACSFGDISTTSFFPAKPLGCYGDGGAIFTDDEKIAERLKSLRVAGKSPNDKYDNREIGMNSRLDTIQAAILLPKLKAFEEYELDAVNLVAKWYSERLTGKFVIPSVLDGYLSSWAQYTVLCKNTEQRDALQKKLKENDIPTMVYYPRGLHQQQAYSWMKLDDSLFPNTIEATRRVLSLPMHPYMDEKTVEKITSLMLE